MSFNPAWCECYFSLPQNAPVGLASSSFGFLYSPSTGEPFHKLVLTFSSDRWWHKTDKSWTICEGFLICFYQLFALHLAYTCCILIQHSSFLLPDSDYLKNPMESKSRCSLCSIFIFHFYGIWTSKKKAKWTWEDSAHQIALLMPSQWQGLDNHKHLLTPFQALTHIGSSNTIKFQDSKRRRICHWNLLRWDLTNQKYFRGCYHRSDLRYEWLRLLQMTIGKKVASLSMVWPLKPEAFLLWSQIKLSNVVT